MAQLVYEQIMKEERKKILFSTSRTGVSSFRETLHKIWFKRNSHGLFRRQLFEPSRKQFDKVMEELKDIANQFQTKILDNFTKK